MTAPQKIPVLFILSRGHSGSTLLDMMLNAHPEIFGLGECEKMADWKFRDRKCGCRESVNVCPFWSAYTVPDQYLKARVRKIHRSKWSSLFGTSNFWFRQYGEGTVSLEQYQLEQERFMQYAHEKTKARYLVDSSKNPDRVAFLQTTETIEPIIIHLVRDGRGVMYSYLKKYGFLVTHMLQWATYNLKVERLRGQTKARYLFVHYDSLVNDPESTLRRLCAELGLEYTPQMLTPSQVEHHQVGGNEGVYDQEVRIKPDVAWRSQLTWWQRSVFEISVGWLNWWYYQKAKRVAR